MPAVRTHRQNVGRQRHHKSRAGQILVPHGRVSGLLWTVNPRQEPKALRELQLFLQPLIADLEKAQGGVGDGATGCDAGADGGPSPSTSSLLSAELAACTTTRGGDRNAPEGCREGKLYRKRSRPEEKADSNSHRWLAALETYCKGYLMVSVPFPPAPGEGSPRCKTPELEEDSATERGTCDGVGESGKGERNDLADSAHLVVHNPMVRTVVERIFADITEGRRPVLRHCFRLMPCELTCCPTLPEMRQGLECLTKEHFPPSSAEIQQLHKIGLSFAVKNNTNVEAKKSYLQAALEATFPTNRFVVIPMGRLQGYVGDVEAVFSVIVVHSTCVMGVQWHFSSREKFNLHALCAKHLELSTSV
ncbi:unnamed protein product [Trypanosoma congolense IL3000]|uniref:WGS project CAEQ00000000 data, annotated contig 435 n=1 Tax=Trypanosoma congolense (strain IL3000) TaxID=1068625 RepID=F9WFX8_TRYCI|nr:unnamed protein product [Trypanosoma congolense IL3000]